MNMPEPAPNGNALRWLLFAAAVAVIVVVGAIFADVIVNRSTRTQPTLPPEVSALATRLAGAPTAVAVVPAATTPPTQQVRVITATPIPPNLPRRPPRRQRLKLLLKQQASRFRTPPARLTPARPRPSRQST